MAIIKPGCHGILAGTLKAGLKSRSYGITKKRDLYETQHVSG